MHSQEKSKERRSQRAMKYITLKIRGGPSNKAMEWKLRLQLGVTFNYVCVNLFIIYHFEIRACRTVLVLEVFCVAHKWTLRIEDEYRRIA
ncbi:hypothetical protein KIN20_012780 [Parelaphostrongylus tenuis]|uniref:Uncharacterized protein n=1 Tax=Parelaphostrongylus tenuis TaxID=148309 RepID=A0AAD5QN12_PARTN|nr:hypothetical protein KIN20_012780 [Parelaphostrongylus tenuis]